MDHYHYHLAIAEDAETALAYLRDHEPDVIVMDIFLPGIDGYQALHQIAARAGSQMQCHRHNRFYTHDTPKNSRPGASAATCRNRSMLWNSCHIFSRLSRPTKTAR